ncbi:MAG: hypothetical protein WCJ58_08545 [bacterium]
MQKKILYAVIAFAILIIIALIGIIILIILRPNSTYPYPDPIDRFYSEKNCNYSRDGYHQAYQIAENYLTTQQKYQELYGTNLRLTAVGSNNGNRLKCPACESFTITFSTSTGKYSAFIDVDKIGSEFNITNATITNSEGEMFNLISQDSNNSEVVSTTNSGISQAFYQVIKNADGTYTYDFVNLLGFKITLPVKYEIDVTTGERTALTLTSSDDVLVINLVKSVLETTGNTPASGETEMQAIMKYYSAVQSNPELTFSEVETALGRIFYKGADVTKDFYIYGAESNVADYRYFTIIGKKSTVEGLWFQNM